MTDERAVKIFEDMIRLIEQNGIDYVTDRDIPLIESAIYALNQKIKRRTERSEK